MRRFFLNALAAVSLLAVFGLSIFLVWAGSDCLDNNYINVPGWLGWACVVEGLLAFVIIIKNAIDAVCVDY